MKVLLYNLFLLLVLSTCGPEMTTDTPVQAFAGMTTSQEKAVGQKTYVVIAAVGDYKYYRAGQGDLRYTVNDANKLYQYFLNPLHENLPKEQVVFLKNELATKARITSALLQTFAKATEKDRVIFYFSGHGLPNMLMPYEATGKNKLTAIDYQEIKAAFKQSRAGTKICFIDACFANSVKSQKQPGRADQKKAAEKAMVDSEIAVMVSSQSYQTSIEYQALKQGVFSYFLIKGLEGLADKNKDKVINILELHQYVYNNVKVYTKNKQVPHTFGRFNKNMPVVKLR